MRQDLEILDVLRTHYFCGIDVETYFNKDKQIAIRYIQLYPFAPKHPEFKNDDVWIFDLTKIDPEDLDLLKDYLFNPSVNLDVVWVGHNLKFDFRLLEKEGFKIDITSIVDTYIYHKCLTAGNPKFYQSSLKECVLNYLGDYLDKTLQRADWEQRSDNFLTRLLDNEVDKYLETDVRILEPLLNALNKRLTPDLRQIVSLECRCVLVTAHLESAGFALDVEYLEDLHRSYREILVDLERKFYGTLRLSDVTLRFNGMKNKRISRLRLNSPKLISSFLNRHGVRNPDNPNEPIVSTADSILSRIDTSKYHEIVARGIEAIRSYRAAQKISSSFVRALLRFRNKNTGRIHTKFGQYSTDTGRYSSSKPNLQNLPRSKEIRDCFIAPKGKKLIIADYSQIEVRVLAEICGDKNLIDIYRKGADIYKHVASNIFKVAYDAVTKEQRQIAKAIVLGFQYGMGAAKFKTYYESNSGQQLDLEKAQAFRRGFFATFPRLGMWHKSIGDAVAKASEENPYYSSTILGRKREFTKPQYNAAINSPVQGTAADIAKYALLFLYRALRNVKDACIVNVVHDEIIVECREQDAEVVKDLVSFCMVRGGWFMKKVPITVEAFVCDKWSQKG